eukprot:UN27159
MFGIFNKKVIWRFIRLWAFLEVCFYYMYLKRKKMLNVKYESLKWETEDLLIHLHDMIFKYDKYGFYGNYFNLHSLADIKSKLDKYTILQFFSLGLFLKEYKQLKKRRKLMVDHVFKHVERHLQHKFRYKVGSVDSYISKTSSGPHVKQESDIYINGFSDVLTVHRPLCLYAFYSVFLDTPWYFSNVYFRPNWRFHNDNLIFNYWTSFDRSETPKSILVFLHGFTPSISFYEMLLKNLQKNNPNALVIIPEFHWGIINLKPWYNWDIPFLKDVGKDLEILINRYQRIYNSVPVNLVAHSYGTV